MRPRLLLSVAAVLVAGLVTTSAQVDLPFAKAETVGMSSKRLERINAFIKEYIDTNQIAGAVTLVARKGKIVHFEAQGWRYKEENQPMEKDAIFSLASMTKPIVSTALMMLWEDGKFMLDDPISKWLPSYANKQVLDPLTGRREAGDARSRCATSSRTRRAFADAGAGRARRSPTARPPREPAAHRTAPAARPKTLAEAVERAASTPLAFPAGRALAVRRVDRLRRHPGREDLRA